MATNPSAPPAHPELARLDALAGHHDIPGPDGTVRWRTLGSGAPLVLLHGGHGSWLHWVRNIEALARRYTVWVPDMPGYLDSAAAPPPTGDDELEPLLAALRATLDRAVGPDTAIGLAGFSFGGLVAARLAARRPRVARLALLGSGGHGTPRPRKLDMRNWRQAATPAQRRDMLRHNLNQLMLHRHAPDELALAVHEISCVATRFRSRTASQGNGMVQALRQYGGPVLLVWGEHDVTATAREVAPAIAADGPGRLWRVLPDAGHWVQYEAADEVNELLARWFAGELRG
ncbi:alpha/beta fold hydrolase [Bordetella petrii]|uniref:Alpha/beta fold hydrolase n=1 Tax=Bordetella petrii TaxID=94624 RepID=A0ABT7W3S4_9BORD|nr:alpha/beta fold hydrolase [Bordetella petrii]MDM9559807.1 alpha/beta fold hydrolase [Bordetella petrii]